MEKPGKFIFTIIALLITGFLLAQTLGLFGKTSLGISESYTILYTVLLSVVFLFLSASLFLEAFPSSFSDHPLVNILSIFDFGDDQDFRLFNGDGTSIGVGLAVGFAFLVVITLSVISFGMIYQPVPAVGAVETVAVGSVDSLGLSSVAGLEISEVEKVWLGSAQPAWSEDILFNYFIPSILTAIFWIVPYFLGWELDRKGFVIAATLACLITSGLVGFWGSTFIPTFAGAHSDAYSAIPSFTAAAIFSFAASWINLMLGAPISVLAHFSNNFFVGVSMAITFSIGSFALVLGIPQKLWRRYKCKNTY